ncbi:DUF3800 domain-containing protein [Actinomycetospora sp. CA-101289]|uniref:DUF3800 domain-containing protein n=1 Tax=Actinomycetospora sp. CA-101289 TaxID=3239893 RepID=UPI003D953595
MARTSAALPTSRVQQRASTSTIFIDESGSRSTASKFFVVAAVKLRKPGLFARRVQELRDQTGFSGELKFSEINRASVPIYREIIAALEESDATLHACVIDGQVHDPFKGDREQWRVYADVVAQLLVGSINRGELVGVLMDTISTPVGCSLEDTVRSRANSRLRSTAVVSAACLDSKSNDVLQVADLLAGSILHHRRIARGGPGSAGSHKGRIATHLGATFGRPTLEDGRDRRVNIDTYRGPAPEKLLSLGVAGRSRRGA